MLTQIKLTNFKCFETETTFPLSQLNLLTGMNGRGKSTLLQSLLLMRQTTEVSETTTSIFLNGSCLNLGTFEEVRNQNTSEEAPIIFEYGSPNHLLHYQLNRNRQADNKDDTTLLIEEVTTSSLRFTKTTSGFRAYDANANEVKGLITFFNLAPKLITSIEEKDSLWSRDSNFDKIHYLSTDRQLGPQQMYPAALAKFSQVGVKGEFTANILYNHGHHLVPEHLCLDAHSHAFASQTNAWLNQIFEGVSTEVIIVRYQERQLLDILFKTSQNSIDRLNKPANLGFGYSQALPIIVAGLLAKTGEILIIENPETHLHPQAQSRLIQFLATVCQGGVQVFIETHSDHVLNAVRVTVRDQLVKPEQLSVLYFHQNREQPIVTPIPVLPTGGIEEWPEGFFDQTLKDFEQLFGM